MAPPTIGPLGTPMFGRETGSCGMLVRLQSRSLSLSLVRLSHCKSRTVSWSFSVHDLVLDSAQIYDSGTHQRMGYTGWSMRYNLVLSLLRRGLDHLGSSRAGKGSGFSRWSSSSAASPLLDTIFRWNFGRGSLGAPSGSGWVGRGSPAPFRPLSPYSPATQQRRLHSTFVYLLCTQCTVWFG